MNKYELLQNISPKEFYDIKEEFYLFNNEETDENF
jgi:hypothetical protein